MIISIEVAIAMVTFGIIATVALAFYIVDGNDEIEDEIQKEYPEGK